MGTFGDEYLYDEKGMDLKNVEISEYKYPSQRQE